MKETAENDWFLAMTENPSMGIDDFSAVGLTASNTALRDKSFYRNSSYIQEKYKTEDGKFDEVTFNKHYDIIAQNYQAFATGNYLDNALADTTFDPYNTMRPIESKVETGDFAMTRALNPAHEIIGFGGIGTIAAGPMTPQELALRLKVFDWETQSYKDYSPNDRALENSVVGYVLSLFEPLVMALYEEAGTHLDPFTGQLISHLKGDYKINDEGEFYYETLGGRSPYGKQIKSVFSTLTVDGSTLNGYDFFDSDGLDKSVTGTIAKTIATIAPLFTPLAPYYGYAMIGSLLLDLLPTMYNITLGNFIDTPESLNYLQGIGRSLRGEVSEYSKNNLLSVENLFNIITDSALLLQQLTTLSKLSSKALGNDKLIAKANLEAAEMGWMKSIKDGMMKLTEITEGVIARNIKSASDIITKSRLKPLLDANNRTAANIALGYMSGLLGLLSYEEALAIGASKLEASAIAWGTVIGMYNINRTGLGEIFLRDLADADKLAYKAAIGKMNKSIQESFESLASAPKKTKLTKLLGVGVKASLGFWDNMKNHSLGFMGKAFGEGLEELSEELVADFVKSTYNLATEFGITSTNKKFDLSGKLERYGMSLLGGTMGGALFAGVDLYQNGRWSQPVNQELTYLLRNGKREELLQELDIFKEKGKLGNSQLSATDYYVDSEGKRIYNTAKNEADSQNEATYNLIRNQILAIDTAINQEGLNLSDDDILDKLVRGDIRLGRVLEAVGKDGINGRVLQDFNTLVTDIANIEVQLSELDKVPTSIAEMGKTPTDKEEREGKVDNRRAELLKTKLELLRKRDYFFSEQASVEYTDKLLFEVNDTVNRPYYEANLQLYIEGRTKRKIDDLSEELIKQLSEDYNNKYKTASILEKFDDAYALYKHLNLTLTDTVNNSSNSYAEYSKLRAKVLSELIDIDKTRAKYGEITSVSDIPYMIVNRHNALEVLQESIAPFYIEGESELDYIERKKQAIHKLSEIVESFKSIGFIDANTKRLLQMALPDTMISLLSGEVMGLINTILEENDWAGENSNYQDAIIEAILSLNGDNADSIKNKILEILSDEEGYDFETNTPIIPEGTKDLLSLVDKLNAEVILSTLYITKKQIENDLNNLRTNPLETFLSNLSLNVNRRGSNLLSLLTKEESDFESGSLDSYISNSVSLDEMEAAEQVLNIAESLVNAADSELLSDGKLFGHNAVLQDFAKRVGLTQEYSTISSDLAQMMRTDIELLKGKVRLLKQIATINQANTFKAAEKTGKNLCRLLGKVFKAVDEYEPLASIEINGIKLFKGMENVETPALDALTGDLEGSDDVYVEIDLMAQVLHNNYTEILRSSSESGAEIKKKLVEAITSIFKNSKLADQTTSVLSPKTESLLDMDVVVYLLAACAGDRKDFNQSMLDLIKSEGNNLVPLSNLEVLVFIGVSMLEDIELFNNFVNTVNLDESPLHLDLVRLFNTLVIDGVGGSGKTSAVVKRIWEIHHKLHPESTLWNSGPTKTLANNLQKSVPGEKAVTIEELIDLILGDGLYVKLKEAIKNEVDDCEFFELKPIPGARGTEKVIKPLTYTDAKAPKVLVIDEATYLSTVEAKIISDWCKEKGVLLILSGDRRQSGYIGKSKIFNIAAASAFAVRTPSLSTSLRVTNIQKKNNNDLFSLISGYTSEDSINRNDDWYPVISSYLETLEFQYLSDPTYPLNGDRIVDSLDPSYVKAILEKATNLIYIYDSTDSESYKLMKTLLDENPELASKVTFATPDLVQGSEASHTIIDLDFSKYENISTKNLGLLVSGVSLFNTVITRALEGSLIIDRGVRSFFLGLLREQVSNYAAKSPDVSKVLKKVTESRIGTLEKSIASLVSPKSSTSVSPTPTGINSPAIKKTSNEALTTKIKEYITKLTNTYSDFPDKDNTLKVLNELLTKLESTTDPTELASIQKTVTDISKTIDTFIDDALEFLNLLNDCINRHNQLLNGSTLADEDKDLLTNSLNVLNSYLGTSGQGVNLNDNWELITRLEKQIPTPSVSPPSNLGSTLEDVISNEQIREDTPIEPQGTNIPNVRVYSFYSRLGAVEENDKINAVKEHGVYSDLSAVIPLKVDGTGSINSSDYDKYASILDTIRSFFQYKRNDFDNLWEEIKEIDTDRSLAFKQAFQNGKFKVVGSTVSLLDHVKEDGNVSNSALGPHVLRLVYLYTFAGSTFEITLGILSNPTTWENSLSNTSTSEERQEVENYKRWYNEVINSLSGNTRFESEDIGNDYIQSTDITHLHRLKEVYGFLEFEKKNPNVIHSPIYIHSGHLSKDTNYATKVAGRAVVFTTKKRYVRMQDGSMQKVTPENIAQLYYRLKSTNTPGAQIRMTVLDPVGKYVCNATDPSNGKVITNGFFDLVNDDLTDSTPKELETLGSKSTGLRLYIGLWNLRALLKRALNALNLAHGDLGEANKKLYKWKHFPFRFTNFECYSKHESMNAEHTNLLLEPEYALYLILLLDNLFNVIHSVIHPVEVDQTTYIQFDNDSLKSLLQDNSGYMHVVDESNGTSKIESGFTASNAYRVTAILSAYYKLAGTKNPKFHIAWEKPIPGKSRGASLLDITPDGLDTYLQSHTALSRTIAGFVTSLFNIAFHGTVNPYGQYPKLYDSEQSKYIPFPKGVFHLPRYASTKSEGGMRQDAYIAKNTDDLFECNVLIQSPHLYITKLWQDIKPPQNETTPVETIPSAPEEVVEASSVYSDQVNSILELCKEEGANISQILFDGNNLSLSDMDSFYKYIIGIKEGVPVFLNDFLLSTFVINPGSLQVLNGEVLFETVAGNHRVTVDTDEYKLHISKTLKATLNQIANEQQVNLDRWKLIVQLVELLDDYANDVKSKVKSNEMGESELTAWVLEQVDNHSELLSLAEILTDNLTSC